MDYGTGHHAAVIRRHPQHSTRNFFRLQQTAKRQVGRLLVYEVWVARFSFLGGFGGLVFEEEGLEG